MIPPFSILQNMGISFEKTRAKSRRRTQNLTNPGDMSIMLDSVYKGEREKEEALFLKIILVIDIYDELNNGTSMTTYRFAEMLKKRGHEVHVLAAGSLCEPAYKANEKQYILATKLAHKQGFAFAEADEELFRRAFAGADVIHFLLPLWFEHKALKVAQEMNIPVSAAFHLQPDNVTYIIHMPWDFLSVGVYKFFNRTFYKHFDHIHCPSRFIADQLVKNGYKAKMHVISNGVDQAFAPPAVPKEEGALFHILMVGRLSPEKRQRVLIDAVAKSKYAGRIQLHLAGRGPCKEALVKQGQALPHPPKFGFYEKEDLIRLIHSCDLYVHASYIEIEAISCMEAFACGLVPVICNSPKSATVQFALDDRSLFSPDDSDDLARKIDYWIEHPQERRAMSGAYAQQGERYRVSESVKAAEEMFAEVIRDHKEKFRGLK